MGASKGLSRRAFLRGAGGVMVSLPFLEAMQVQGQSPAVPKRLVVWYAPNGHQAGGFPTSMDLMGTSLEPLEAVKEDLIVTRGLSLVSAGGQNSADHPTGFGHILTGDQCEISGDDILAANISIDQFVAKRMGVTRFASSLHGVRATRTMSWDRSATGVALPVRPDGDPRSAFDRLFSEAEISSDPEVAMRNALRQGSIMDAVRGSYEQLACRLGNEDRARVSSHLENIRAIEARLQASPSAACSELPGRPADIDYDIYANHQQTGRRHMELLVKALECDLTRVGSMQWYSHTGLFGESYVWDGLESHHEASHNNRHAAHDRVFAGELAYFLELLRTARAEDGQSLLHHTAVLCVSELGLNTDLHHLADMGILIAGSAGGVFRTGQYIDFIADQRAGFTRGADWKRKDEGGYYEDFDVPHNRLLVELINAVAPEGADPVSDFGKAGLGRGGLPAIRV